MFKKTDFNKTLIGDVSRNRTFSIGTYAVLGLVAAVMTDLNYFTDKGFLTYCTGVFAILCLSNIIMTLPGSFGAAVAKTFFAVEVLCMFAFFLISGNPDGFSAIWICMLPSLGMFFFGRFRGTAICIAMFALLVFLFWTQKGQAYLMYDYNATFKMRFPVLFVAFHMLAFLLESMRVKAYKEMRQMQHYYQVLSVHDQLTGMLNRQGMYSSLEEDEQYRNAKTLGIAILDIDFFKKINDVYGHIVGDTVLKEFSKIVKSVLLSPVCRWGGEEFVVIFTDDSIKPEKFEKLLNIVENYTFSADDKTFNITASIGICTQSNFDIKNIDTLIGNADKALYCAKSTGRNKIVYYDELINNSEQPHS